MQNQIIELSNEQIIETAPSVGATKAHHLTSDKYSFIPTTKAINFLRDCGWKPIMCGEGRANKEDRKGFQKHMIRFSRNDLLVNGNRMDLLLYNSHDRGSAFKLIGGVFRFVCSNGMVIGDKMMEFSHKHMGFDPEDFMTSARMIDKRLHKTTKVIDKWQAIDLEPDESGVFAQAAHSLLYDDPKTAPIEPARLLTPRRYEDKETNLWTTFNRVQENILKGGIRGRNAKGRRTTTRKVKSIDKDRKINQALWILTERMAKIKKAA